jgi:hypothetical protein
MEAGPPDTSNKITKKRKGGVAYLYFVDIADGMVELHGAALLQTSLLSSAAV